MANVLIVAFLAVAASVELCYEIAEESEAGSFVGQIPRTPNIESTFFKLSHDMDSSYFSVERETGIIKTVFVIYRESLLRCRGQEDCDITFKVGSSSTDEFRTYNVKIAILDINNSPPTFYPDYIKYEIDHEEDFTELELPAPYDYDSPSLGVKTCFIDSGIDWARLSSSNLDRMKLLIDNRKIEAKKILQVRCVDHGSPPLRGSLTIEISRKMRTRCLQPRFDYKTLQISLPQPINSETVVASLKAFQPSQDYIIAGIHSLRFGLIKAGTDFHIDPINGTIYVNKIGRLLQTPVQLNASVCCGDLCDYCLVFVEFLKDVKRPALHISVNSVREGDILEISASDKSGTVVAYVVLESNADGIATCSVKPPGIVSFRNLSDRSFLLINDGQPQSVDNRTQCLDLLCDIDGLFFGSKSIFINLVAPLDSNLSEIKDQSPTLKKLTFVMTSTIIGVMLFVFSIFLMVKCHRLYMFQKMQSHSSSDHIDMRRAIPPNNGEKTKLIIDQKTRAASSIYYKESVSDESGCYFAGEGVLGQIRESVV